MWCHQGVLSLWCMLHREKKHTDCSVGLCKVREPTKKEQLMMGRLTVSMTTTHRFGTLSGRCSLAFWSTFFCKLSRLSFSPRNRWQAWELVKLILHGPRKRQRRLNSPLFEKQRGAGRMVRFSRWSFQTEGNSEFEVIDCHAEMSGTAANTLQKWQACIWCGWCCLPGHASQLFCPARGGGWQLSLLWYLDCWTRGQNS